MVSSAFLSSITIPMSSCSVEARTMIAVPANPASVLRNSSGGTCSIFESRC
jgi:hypothetical protein